MELRQLATFVAVAEEGGFTRAAERLHVVQSAVSAGVRKLERDARGDAVRPLDPSRQADGRGRALLPGARATLAAAKAARDAVDEARGGLRGTVVLGSMQAQGMRAIDLAAALAEFRSEHPGVEVAIRHAGSSEMAREVIEGRVDLGFVALPGDAPAGLTLIPLASEPIMLAVPAGHPIARSAGIRLASLRDETIVDLPPGWGIRMAVDRSFTAAGATRVDRLRGERHRDDGRVHPQRTRDRPAAPIARRDHRRDRFRAGPRSPATVPDRDPIPANAGSAPPPARCSRRSSATPAPDSRSNSAWNQPVRLSSQRQNARAVPLVPGGDDGFACSSRRRSSPRTGSRHRTPSPGASGSRSLRTPYLRQVAEAGPEERANAAQAVTAAQPVIPRLDARRALYRGHDTHVSGCEVLAPILAVMLSRQSMCRREANRCKSRHDASDYRAADDQMVAPSPPPLLAPLTGIGLRCGRAPRRQQRDRGHARIINHLRMSLSRMRDTDVSAVSHTDRRSVRRIAA